MKTAAIVLIGNELLSGKIVDENAAYAAVQLRAAGVSLRRIAVVPDEPDEIVAEVRRCSQAVDVVVTSGGVGPTHDDITLECIARAFDRRVLRDPALEDLLRAHFKDRLTEDHLRMADLPEGAELVFGGHIAWPVVKLGNVYILPGVPQIFRAKLDAILPAFRGGRFVLRSLYLQADEGMIAALLRDVESRLPVQIGSYPRFDGADHRVRVTVEARESAPVDEAVRLLVLQIPPEWIVRVDPPV